MTKLDIPPLGPVPRKRRQLQQALDVHLAMWLDLDTLTPSERRRVLEERATRKRRDVVVLVGFTGTRAGMTPKQRWMVLGLLEELKPAEGHHGDCVGADAQFHDLCLGMGIGVVLHPPANPSMRAWCKGAIRAEPTKPFLERNKEIVRDTTILIAAPKEMREPEAVVGSGTWSTVRHARKRGTVTKVVMPDGTLNEGDGR